MEKRVSPYNLSGWPTQRPQKDIFICDVTLRDGEQTAGVGFSIDEKVEGARMLDELGIGQIQTGVIRSQEDYDTAKALVKTPRVHAKIETMSAAFSNEWKDQISMAVDTGCDIVHTLIPLSPYVRAMYATVPDDELLFDRTAEAIEFMRASGVRCINVSLLDATRSSEALLSRMARLLSKHKVERMRFADTVGTATPLSIFYLTRMILDVFDTCGGEAPKLGVHLHDDFGLATANALAAVAAGADYLDLSVNGLGERAGNPDLTQVVMSLEALCDIKTGIRTDGLCAVSKYFEKISGIPVPTNKPLIGSMAFSDESDSHALASSSDPFAYQGILAESVGSTRKLILGKKNGVNAIRLKMQQLNLAGGDSDLYQRVLAQVRKESSDYHGTIMPDGRFIEIAENNRT